jgi:hypothetical protein
MIRRLHGQSPKRAIMLGVESLQRARARIDLLAGIQYTLVVPSNP